MGLLGKLFGSKDPTADLEAAEAALGRGDAVKALEMARRGVRKAEGEAAERARELVARAHATIASGALETAAEREEAELLEEAADWVDIAIENTLDEEERERLEARREELLDRHDAMVNPPAPTRERDPEADEDDEDEGSGLHLDDHYALLVDMLSDDVAARYRDRPESFRRACVALSEGETDVAVPLFDEAVEADPADPLARLERGRCRLVVGDHEGALEDLEVAWEGLGDEPLDATGALSVPELWALAAQGGGDAEGVVRRLEELADPERGQADLSEHYASALLALGRTEEAQAFLERAVRAFPKHPTFPLQMAHLLVAQERRDDAIELLEMAIAPSCTSGSCAKPPLHPPSLRLLATLHLAADEPRLDRVEDLLSFLARSARGRLTAADHALLAAFHEASGDDEAAAEARAEAERLAPIEASRPVKGLPGGAPKLGGKERVL